MYSFAKNYERAALGGAVAVALGLTYMGWLQVRECGRATSPPPEGKRHWPTPQSAISGLIAKAKASMNIDRSWAQATTAEGRPIDLFTDPPVRFRRRPEKPAGRHYRSGRASRSCSHS